MQLLDKKAVSDKAVFRFLSKILVSDECWEWCGPISHSTGYGTFTISSTFTTSAHRFSYTHFCGPIPDGLVIDHLCRNRRCVRPNHLEPVTQRENLLRGDTANARRAAQTHCIHGHPFNTENTWIRPSGGRMCLRCNTVRKRRYRLEGRLAE